MKVRLALDVDLDELADRMIRECSRDDLLRFVRTLDAGVAEWGFTRALLVYFSLECKKEGLEDV